MSQYCDERYDAYNETERRANKPHTCAACGCAIERRERYFYVSWIFERGAYSVKRCLACQAVHLHLRQLGQQDEMWPSETLSCGEEYTDHWGKEPPPHIARLAFLSPAERQALVFRVFRTRDGDHVIARDVEDARAVFTDWRGWAAELSEVPGDVGLPIVVDGATRLLYRYPENNPTYQELGYRYRMQRQTHVFRGAREWAVEYGRGPLCSGEPIGALHGPLQRLYP